MIGENAVDAVLTLHAELIPGLEERHESEKQFENEITDWGSAAWAIKDLIRLANDQKQEIVRLHKVAADAGLVLTADEQEIW